jgi:CheY-like chemotaxis protein
MTILASADMLWAFRDGKETCLQSTEFRRIRSTSEVAKGLETAISKQEGRDTSSTEQVRASAENAAATFTTIDFRHPERRFRILWVDDQPGNNAGLVYAFEALGIIVITVEDTDRVSETLTELGSFDLVITDMFRNAVRGKPDQPRAGWDTVNLINTEFKQLPIVIYAGSFATQWAKEHNGEPLPQNVMAITNRPRVVIEVVTEMARRKGL